MLSSDCWPSHGLTCVKYEVLNGFNDWNRVQQCIALPAGAGLLGGASQNDVPPDEPSTVQYMNAVLGGADADDDGIQNSQDNCATAANQQQEDSDGDTYGDACDCLPMDTHNWDTPSEVQGLGFFDKQTIDWTRPAFLGTDTITYDTLRSAQPSGFVSSVQCVETNAGGDTLALDADVPAAGQVFYYLIRARSACPNGRGPLGTDSQGVPRLGAACD